MYLHSITDGFSRLAYTEPLADEKGATAAAFLERAKVWFAAPGINHIHRVVTDNGACYRSGDFARIVGNQARHQKTKPYTSSGPASNVDFELRTCRRMRTSPSSARTARSARSHQARKHGSHCCEAWDRLTPSTAW